MCWGSATKAAKWWRAAGFGLLYTAVGKHKENCSEHCLCEEDFNSTMNAVCVVWNRLYRNKYIIVLTSTISWPVLLWFRGPMANAANRSVSVWQVLRTARQCGTRPVASPIHCSSARICSIYGCRRTSPNSNSGWSASIKCTSGLFI